MSENTTNQPQNPGEIFSSNEEQSIRKHLRHIHNRHRVCLLAFARLRGVSLSEEAIEFLLETLQTTRESLWRHRVVAARTLSQTPLTPKQQETLLTTLYDFLSYPEYPLKLYQASRPILKITFIATVGLTALVTYLSWISKVKEDGIVEIFIFLFLTLTVFVFPFLFPVFMLLRSNRDTEERIASLATLERLPDPRSASVLTTWACHASSEIRGAAERALLTVLPTLTTTHYGQLAAHVVPDLCRILNGDRRSYPVASEALILATLDALEKIGDGRALSPVQRIAVANFPSCQRKAQSILPILQERQERERHSGMLLRAASAPETTPEELLRPATEATATASEQLLRPSFSDNLETQ
jgi:hypothetical protein